MTKTDYNKMEFLKEEQNKRLIIFFQFLIDMKKIGTLLISPPVK